MTLQTTRLPLFLSLAITILLAAPTVALPAPQKGAKPERAAKSAIVSAMEQELERSLAALRSADQPAYFINYTLTEQQRAEVQGSNGALLSSQETRTRWLETSVRVGSYDLDNTRKVGGRDAGYQASFGTPVPLDDDVPVLRRAIWSETDRQYRGAAEALLKIQTWMYVKAATA